VKQSDSSSILSSSTLSTQQIAQFKEVCSSLRIDLSDEMIEKFQTYLALLLQWNKKIHLVSKRDAKSDRILRHFVDSLSIFRAIDFKNDTNLLDLGSGAGFPAIPIKIVRNDVKMALVESIHKKVLFLQKLNQVLKLQKVFVLNCRAEALADQAEFEERFDLVTAKAFGKLEKIVPLSLPFLKIGGLLVAYKGKGVKREIEEIDSLEDCRIRDVIKIEKPEINLLRWFVLVEKVKCDLK